MSAKLSFPLRHVSIRVPWHDAGWNGTVCKSPRLNSACLKLVNIANNKDEAAEESVAGKSIKDIPSDHVPPCVKERGTFMADAAFERFHEHPYSRTSPDTHSHFAPTTLRFPAYSAAGVPFRWMMKSVVFGEREKNTPGLIHNFPLDTVDTGLEPKLSFETNWVQDHRNHRALLDCFWNHIRPEESLVFFYAKQVPLVEDTGRRILIGAGRVKQLGDLVEYAYHGSSSDNIRSLLWERMVSHSIRPDFKDGFLLPYHEALEKSDEGRAFDPAEVVAFAPDDRFLEFSYATEHVGNDAAISALLSCRSALLRSAELFNVSIGQQEKWIDRELGRLWQKRGPFPGLGSILCATGVPMGNFIAQSLADKVGDDASPWPYWLNVLDNPATHLPAELACHIDSTIAKSWLRMAPERRAFLELLSRIDLSSDQAAIIAIPEERKKLGIDLQDSAFVENPYLIYEASRLSRTPISVGVVDRGMFPTSYLRNQFPISEPTLVKTAVDARRLRALTIRELETAAVNGHTLRSREDVILSLRKREEGAEEQNTEVTADLLAVAEDERFAGEIRLVSMAGGSPAYQLERLGAVGDLIRRTVDRRTEPKTSKRHDLQVNWRDEIDASFTDPMPTDLEERDKEERAREEKAAALAELAASRFSVLIGPAGTGKTTLLSILCKRPEIHDDNILLLAPTGKARVRMEEVARKENIPNFEAKTLAQFLNGTGRYDGRTQRYLLTGRPGDKGARTVIVDECSMLTEEMMAALLEALEGVHRLIFVGDPRQLPPIGAGRPFVDIIARLTPDAVETIFPRVGPAYAELTVPRRQGSGERDDLQLAAWFGGSGTGPGDDQVFEILAGRRKSDTIRFVSWETPDELEQALPDILSETLGFDSSHEEWQAFALSLGGQLDDKGSAWFNQKFGPFASSGKQAEAWQILSPVRQKPWGVDTLNRFIHLHYKGKQVEKAREHVSYRSIPVPMGDQLLIYGDKVINNSNWSVPKGRLFPKSDQNGYLANGEIGMIVGHRRTKKRNWFPKALEVEFSTQTGVSYSFYATDFSEESNTNLELAYALTVHKAQGSEFDVVFLVLPRSPLMLTRELIYTALTRQKQKVVVLHQGSATDLQKLSSERYSAAATRLTNLFGPPRPVLFGDRFLEEGLIHLTTRGEAVRSKSEVIIANLLHAKNVKYHYEHPLEMDDVVKYPDFTIEDDDTGTTYYWEHCGMLHDLAYKRRWEEKKVWYRDHGILPHEEGGGPKGTLIETRDEKNGSIDSKKINALIAEVLVV